MQYCCLVTVRWGYMQDPLSRDLGEHFETVSVLESLLHSDVKWLQFFYFPNSDAVGPCSPHCFFWAIRQADLWQQDCSGLSA